MLAQTSRKTRVRAISSTSRATSLGVLRRLAPSIRRDHPVKEGLTGVGGNLDDDGAGDDRGAAGDRAAVTARFADHRCRLAGHRRFIDQSGAATTSPSPAISSPASTRIKSPLRKLAGADGGVFTTKFGLVEPLGAHVRYAIFLSEAARALPRPSASASAKVEKTTVNQSQKETAPVNQAGSGWRR